MADKDHRRSDRISAPSDAKNKRPMTELTLGIGDPCNDPQSITGKRGRQEEQTNQGANINIDGNMWSNLLTSQNATVRNIACLLDHFEKKDTHGLFSMPVNLQDYDYEEFIRRPNNFAALRQKLIDGMYTTLESFQIDLLMVFLKRASAFSPDSVTFKQVMALNDHALKIFNHFKNNYAYAEMELSTWHRKYFNNAYVGTSTYAAQSKCSMNSRAPVYMEQSEVAEEAEPSLMVEAPFLGTSSQPRVNVWPWGPRGHPQYASHVAQQLDAYTSVGSSDPSLPMVGRNVCQFLMDSEFRQDSIGMGLTEQLNLLQPTKMPASMPSIFQQGSQCNQKFSLIPQGGGNKRLVTTEQDLVKLGQSFEPRWGMPGCQYKFDWKFWQTMLIEFIRRDQKKRAMQSSNMVARKNESLQDLWRPLGLDLNSSPSNMEVARKDESSQDLSRPLDLDLNSSPK